MKQTVMKYFGIVAIAMMLAPAESRAQQPLVVDTPFVHDPVMAMVPSARIIAVMRYWSASVNAFTVRSAISCTDAGASTIM